MNFRMAKNEDIKDIMKIVKKAQNYLKDQGIDQWQNNYPNEVVIQNDIDNNEFYVLTENNSIIGIAALSFKVEETYNKIYEGKWITDNEYGVIHRMAVDMDKKRSGLGSILLKEIEKICRNKDILSMKIDTHRMNKSMRSFLEKNGFEYCGIIYLKDGNERVAFEKVLF